MPDISAIIVSWNTRELLRECLVAVDAATKGWSREILVVDNNSADESARMVRESFPEVVVLENDQNLGFAGGNNVGLRRAKGRYYLLVNSDVKVERDCLENLMACMQRYPETAIVGPKVLDLRKTIQQSWTSFPSLREELARVVGWRSGSRTLWFAAKNEREASTGYLVDALYGVTWLVRAEAVRETGLLDERFFMYLEDVDWCKRFKERGWEIRYCPGATVYHHGGASSASAERPETYLRVLQRSRMLYWMKHRSVLAVGSLVLINLLHHIIRLPYLALKCAFASSKRRQSITRLKGSILSMAWLMGYALTLGRLGQGNERNKPLA